MQRILKSLGGGETGGSEFAESIKRLAISKQQEGFFQREQKLTLKSVAAMRGLSDAQTSVLMGAGQVAEKMGKVEFFLTKLQAGTQAFTSAAGYGFAALSGSIMGFVTAGLAGTAEGQRFSYLFQQISREIAGIFMPTIRMASRWLENLLGWFRSLTGEQQRNYEKWALFAVAATGIVFAGGKIIATFLAIAAAIKAAALALGVFIVLGSGGTALPLVMGALALAGVGAAAYAGYKSGQRKKVAGGEVDNQGMRPEEDLGGFDKGLNSFMKFITGKSNVPGAPEALFGKAEPPPAVGSVFSGITKLVGMIPGMGGARTEGDGHTAPSLVGGTAESFSQTYARIQQAAAGTDPVLTEAEKQTALLEGINDKTTQLVDAANRDKDKKPGMKP